MTEIDDYFSLYPSGIHALCEDLRGLINTAVPGVQEKLVRGWQLVGYRTPSADGSRYFCFIAPFSDRVRLGFEWGVLMGDDARLLQDTGSQVRSIYLSSTAELQPDLLLHYIGEAARVASLSKEEKTTLALHIAAERDVK